MARPDTVLTPTQQRAIVALLSERTVEAAAIACKIGLRTLWRWMKTPAFSAAYRAARATAVDQAISRLQRASAEAVDALTTIVNDLTAPAAVRVTAASKILEMAIRGTSHDELARRLEALEQSRDILPDTAPEEVSIVA